MIAYFRAVNIKVHSHFRALHLIYKWEPYLFNQGGIIIVDVFTDVCMFAIIATFSLTPGKSGCNHDFLSWIVTISYPQCCMRNFIITCTSLCIWTIILFRLSQRFCLQLLCFAIPYWRLVISEGKLDVLMFNKEHISLFYKSSTIALNKNI